MGEFCELEKQKVDTETEPSQGRTLTTQHLVISTLQLPNKIIFSMTSPRELLLGLILACILLASSCQASGDGNRDYDGRRPLFGVVSTTPSGESYEGNRDYDGRGPLFGVVSDHHDKDYHSRSEEMESVPDAFLIFYALARLFD